MIRPSTRVFGLVTANQDDAWLARLYNALFGFNGLDAAYVVFVVQPPKVGAVLKGLLEQQRAHHVHVAPSLWAEAAKALDAEGPFVDVVDAAGPRFEHARRLVEFAAPQRAVLLEWWPEGTRSAALNGLFADLGAALPVGELELTVTTAPRAEPAHRVAADLAIDTSFEGDPLRRVTGSPKEVWVATSWALAPSRRRAWPPETVLGPPFTLWVRRAGDELAAQLGVDARVPNDLEAALAQTSFRPCQLTDDGFRRAYPHLGVAP
ncbi:MAG: hypothetical protein JNJ54_11990 [Myxococcaceae bacterium]|nr:hypothetical protein [Myxococcaceae bacterium]